MAKPIKRTKITIIDPSASDEEAIIRHKGTAIDLRKVQAAIDARRNNQLSWQKVSDTLGAGLTILGEPAEWKRLAYQLRPTFAAANHKTAEELSAQENANLRTGNPMLGLADSIIQHFDLGDSHPEFQDVLRNAEAHSLNKGVEYRAKVARSAPDAGPIEDGQEMPLNEHERAIAEIRVQEEAAREEEGIAASKRTGATFVGSGGQTHRKAHGAARRLGPRGDEGSKGGPYDSVLRLVAEARREKGWSHPAQSDAPDGWTR